MSNKICNQKELYKSCYNLFSEYLNEISPKSIDISKYFNPEKKTSMDDIVLQFVQNLQDYNMMPRIIGFLREDRNPVFREIFFNYSRDEILKNYTEESLYKRFCEVFPVNNKDSKINCWRKYAKSVTTSCKYLGKFKDSTEFNNYIDSFNGSLEILKELQKSVYGMGFALACNTVKDLGFTDYAKPDTHTTDVVFSMTGNKDPIEVLNTIRAIAKANNDSAFNVDRMIWLICSGYYFMDNINIPSHKQELIAKIENILAE